MRTNRNLLTIASLCVLTVWASSAYANNGIQRLEDELSFPAVYIACLGETVKFEIKRSISFHIFVTPSGNFHLLDNWKLTYMLTGNSTQRTWYARGGSPFQQNVGPGETVQYTANVVAKPLTGDGPKFKFHENFKVTVNANGELVVNMWNFDGVDPSEHWQCFGKK